MYISGKFANTSLVQQQTLHMKLKASRFFLPFALKNQLMNIATVSVIGDYSMEHTYMISYMEFIITEPQ